MKERMDMTRTNIVLDETLVQKCRQLTGIPTQRSLIDYALRELLRHGQQRKVLELKGAVAWDGDLTAWRAGRGA
jgi:Arc/MetJ family transcription regulator